MEDTSSALNDSIGIETNALTLFDCRGEVNVKQIHFPETSYLKSYEKALSSTLSFKPFSFDTQKCCDVRLFGKRWDYGSVLYKHLDALFKMASQEVMQIEDGATVFNSLGTNSEKSMNTARNHKTSRVYCVELYHFIQEFVRSLCSSNDYLWMLQELFPVIIKKLDNVQRQLRRLTDLPDYVYLHGCNSLGNNSIQPSYHLLHLNLDLRWLNVTLLLTLSNAKEYSETMSGPSIQHSLSDFSEFYVNLQRLINELFDIVVKRFEKIESNSLGKKSPFVCTCVQELWALLQILSDSLYRSNKGKRFWDLTSEYMFGMNGFNGATVFINDSEAVYSKLSCTSRIMCSLWALSNIAKLYQLAGQEVISCYPLLEDLLRIATEDISETSMRTCLLFVESLCIDIWEPKVEPIVMLWEYFQKKLNNHFYVPGAAPDTLAVISKNARGLLNQIKSFLSDVNSVRDSFQHFLRILGLHLRKTKDEPRHWRLIKARIFTKLSPANIANLTQIGEYHFISLLLTLALTLGYGQVGNKMIELGNLSNSYNRRNGSSLEFIKGQIAFVLVILENNGNAESAIKPIVQLVNSLSFVEYHDSIRLYADAVQDILLSYDDLTQGQHLLIDTWLTKYLTSSTKSDSSKLLSAVLKVVSRPQALLPFQKPDAEFLMFTDRLWTHLEPYLSANLTPAQCSVPSEVPDIAAALASMHLSLNNQEKFKIIFSIFISHEVSDTRLIKEFLCRFIEYYGFNNVLPGYNKVFIKAWLRCCFQCDQSDESDMKRLTTFISTLPDIKYLVDGCEQTLSSSEEPLLMFFMCLHNKYMRLEDIYEKQSLREKLLGYVDGMEVWIKSLMATPVYFNKIKALFISIGNMFRLISPLLYVKSKPNTLLQQLIDQLLLPFSILNPEAKINENIVGAIKVSLHLFIQGLMALNPEEDHYILRTLKELITIYVPRCVNLSRNIFLANSSFSLIEEFCTFDLKLRTFILQTVCNSFLKRKARRPTNQAIFGLTFIKEIMISHGQLEHIFSDLVKFTFERLCDIVMYCESGHPVRSLAQEIIKLYLGSGILKNNSVIVDDISTLLSALSNENLAWSSRQMFELLTFISSEAPTIVIQFLPKLQSLIKEVEVKRGVGYDRILRNGYETIEKCLKNTGNV